MADAPYLICLALLEQGGQRALPINGKSQQQPLEEGADPGDDGRTLALELLVRLWQRSDEQGALCRSAGDQSLLLVQLPQVRWTGFSGQAPSLTSEAGHRP
jgi:hypothetical protein